MPFLKRITIDTRKVDTEQYPFSIPAIKNGLELDLTSNVTFLVGENGAGKSTILEAVAYQCEFNLSGGGRNHNYDFYKTESSLGSCTRLAWGTKVSQGFFMRAESFFNFATYLDAMAEEDDETLLGYGGKSLHAQSHGESFLSLFSHRFKRGIFILDEPEAALSPNRQLTFLSIIHQLEKAGHAQFVISTHSPILLCYPGATIFNIAGGQVSKVGYQDTEHFQLTKNFLEAPERYLEHLFEP